MYMLLMASNFEAFLYVLYIHMPVDTESLTVFLITVAEYYDCSLNFIIWQILGSADLGFCTVCNSYVSVSV